MTRGRSIYKFSLNCDLNKVLEVDVPDKVFDELNDLLDQKRGA